MEETGLGWAGWIGIAGGIAGVLSCLIGLTVLLAPSRRDILDELTNDPTYRHDLAAALAGTSLGQHYHDRLERGLASLDSAFGAPSSAAALGLCIIIALIYAWAGFSVAWGAGGPGAIISYPLFPEDTRQPERMVIATLSVLLPTGFFGLGVLIGPRTERCERRLLTRLQKVRLRWVSRPKRRRAKLLAFRISLTIVVLFVLAVLAAVLEESAETAVLAGAVWGSLAVLGVVVGTKVWPLVRSHWTRALVSTIAAAAAVQFFDLFIEIAEYFILFLFEFVNTYPYQMVSIFAEVVIVVSAFTVAVGVAGVVAVAGAAAGATAGVVFVVVGNDGTAGALFAIAAAGAGAVAVGMLRKPGRYPGCIGAVLGFASIGLFSETGLIAQLTLTILIFGLVLPLINGVVDWVSWWVTRWLGAHLLQSFGPGATARRVSGLAIAHGLADLLLAGLMLLAMAFTLALGFEAYNQASLWQVGEQAFDLETFMAQAAAAPFSDGAWLTLMLLTTLVPTFLHVAVVCMSPLGFLFLSARRHEWAKNLEAWDTLDEPTQSRTRRAVAGWMAHGRILLWLLAGLMALGLFALIATAIALLHDGGFADYVADAAFLGINLARWLAGN